MADLAAPLPATHGRGVIGGGLAGCALAYYLARSGMDVVVIERGELNREASGTNSGSFHFQIAIHQLTGFGPRADRGGLLADVRLHAAAADVWSELEGELGTDLGVHVTGWADGGRDSRRARDPGGQAAHREGRPAWRPRS